MSIVQTSEKIIRNTYLTLEEYMNKEISHNESDLFYKDGAVYKIYKKIFRLYRQSYMWILDQNKFKNAINIESLLYQGDKLIGSTTKYYEGLTSIQELFQTRNFDLNEIKNIYNILKQLQKELLKLNLCYIDPNLSNICIYNNEILISDIDGVYYKPDKKIIESSYINFLKTILSLLIKDNVFKYENHIQKTILSNLLGNDLSNIDNIVESITKTKKDDINEKYLKLKKIDFAI